MSTSSPMGDLPITIKINYNGRMCRIKLPLRDTAANTLEDKLRESLKIDPTTPCTFERYSDSAASFVVLDKRNHSIYKQLYRAAKAKQRLKIKVTTTLAENENQETTESTPEPTVETSAVPSPALNDSLLGESGPEPPKTQESEQEPALPLPEIAQTPSRPDVAIPTATASAPQFDQIDEPSQEQEAKPPAVPAKIPSFVEPIVSSSCAPAPIAASVSPCPFLNGRPGFAVCCNNCDATILDIHYHCSICDDGDYDLCITCVEQGVTCRSDDHWLIKRFLRGGQIITSTTEKISPKPKQQARVSSPPPPLSSETLALPMRSKFWALSPTDNPLAAPPVATRYAPIRTCNGCVQEMPESQFVHCQTCEDFDLCVKCFRKDAHGHDPAHPFESVVPDIAQDPAVTTRLAAGRNQRHTAICDGCDRTIYGVRHKCLDCPDWDYCSDCVKNAEFVHENHRFIPIYGRIPAITQRPVTHRGIRCDGPLCFDSVTYIRGVRYKCAVCDDKDFCEKCEACPSNTHNKTHPLIKFKTPVRSCSVTTTGDRRSGVPMPTMGDRRSTSNRSTSTAPSMAPSPIQTVCSVQPVEEPVEEPNIEEPNIEEPKTDEPTEEPQVEEAPVETPQVPEPESQTNETVKQEPVEGKRLGACFVSETVEDYTVMEPNHVFEQSWTLLNNGSVAWPVGTSAKFILGDYMGVVDPSHPSTVEDLETAHQSSATTEPVEVGSEHTFTIRLRAPWRPGVVTSYWRLTTPQGYHFGHRLWCEIKVKAPEPSLVPQEMQAMPQSQMIFPKLEKESPVSSIHEELRPKPSQEVEAPQNDDLEELADDDDWEDSVLTDDEYDLIDASDEEFCDLMSKKETK